jgi:hypothetical protein
MKETRRARSGPAGLASNAGGPEGPKRDSGPIPENASIEPKGRNLKPLPEKAIFKTATIMLGKGSPEEEGSGGHSENNANENDGADKIATESIATCFLEFSIM